MSAKRQLRLGTFLSVPGNHLSGWRHPDAVAETDMDFGWYMKLAQMAEAACFDTIFFQDTVAVAGSDRLLAGDMTSTRLSRIVRLEPTATLAALAVGTRHIGLIATATTTYNEPCNIARRFATIDHISKGRAGDPGVAAGGIFRTGYEGRTLRENLGLRVPRSRYAG